MSKQELQKILKTSKKFEVAIILSYKGIYYIQYNFDNCNMLEEEFKNPEGFSNYVTLVDSELKKEFIKNKLTDQMVERINSDIIHKKQMKEYVEAQSKKPKTIIPEEVKKYINDNLVCERTIHTGTNGIYKYYWYEIKIKDNVIFSTCDELESNITADQMKKQYIKDLIRGVKNNSDWDGETEDYETILNCMKGGK